MRGSLGHAVSVCTCWKLADLWCTESGASTKDSTVSVMRKRIGATLNALHYKGAVRQEGLVEGRIGWWLVWPFIVGQWS